MATVVPSEATKTNCEVSAKAALASDMDVPAHAAARRISEASQEGYKWGVDCDLKGYFDTVNHDLLIQQLSQSVSDNRVLRLIGKIPSCGSPA